MNYLQKLNKEFSFYEKINPIVIKKYNQIHNEKIDTSNALLLIEKVGFAEEWIAYCFQVEATVDLKEKATITENFWLSGLEKFNHSGLYLENIGYYYYRNKNFIKAKKYLEKAKNIQASSFVFSLGVNTSYKLQEYEMVIEYFKKGKESNFLFDEDTFYKISDAFLKLNKYEEALVILNTLKKNNNIKDLPKLKETLLKNFSNEKELNIWAEKVSLKYNNIAMKESLEFSELLDFSFYLIEKNKFNEAKKLLFELKNKAA